MPKIVIFWGKPTGPINGPRPHPIKRIGRKLPTYMELLDILSKSAEVYIAIGYDNYQNNLKFKDPFKYEKGRFTKVKGIIKADAVYDRSARMSYPNRNPIVDRKVVNCNQFKVFSNNKWKLYKLFPKYMPETYFVKNIDGLNMILKKFTDTELVVAKPYNNFGGKGIIIDKKDKLSGLDFNKPYLIQKFRDTSMGIPGLVRGLHDLRIVVVNGKIVWATIRQPSRGTLLANVSLGGKIKEVPIKKIPAPALKITKALNKSFSKKYHNPLFSIDFGFENGKPFIFEINDQIGFPLPDMEKNTFIKELSNLLLEKARLK